MDTLLETCPMAENNLRNLYEIYLELGHDVFEEKIKKPMENYLHDSTNDIGIHSLNMVIANAMENLKLGEVGNDSIEITSFGNNFLDSKYKNITAVPNISPNFVYENPCYFDKSYDNPLFMHNFEMHGNESVCLENVYDKALDDGPLLFDNIMHSTVESDQSSCFSMSKSGFANFNPTIFELDKSYVFVDHEKHALSDSYIVEFVHDATENYYERGKCGCRNFHVTKIPLFVLKVLKLFLLHLPMLVVLCFNDLFYYKIPLHRKWVRLRCF